MCVSINGPGDLDLRPFDLETGVRIALKVGNLPQDLGTMDDDVVGVIQRLKLMLTCKNLSDEYSFAFSNYSLCSVYATDGRTDRRTDKNNAYWPLPYGRGSNSVCVTVDANANAPSVGDS